MPADSPVVTHAIPSVSRFGGTLASTSDIIATSVGATAKPLANKTAPSSTSPGVNGSGRTVSARNAIPMRRRRA